MGSVVAPGGVGVYLTNETFLYRVVGVVASDAGELVEPETATGWTSCASRPPRCGRAGFES